jgi:hypothetical protein
LSAASSIARLIAFCLPVSLKIPPTDEMPVMFPRNSQFFTSSIVASTIFPPLSDNATVVAQEEKIKTKKNIPYARFTKSSFLFELNGIKSKKL